MSHTDYKTHILELDSSIIADIDVGIYTYSNCL